MYHHLVSAAGGSVAYRAALLVAMCAGLACSDVPCPAGWMEVNQRCVDQTMNASAVGGAAASPGGQAPAADSGSADERTSSAMPAQTASDAGAPAMGGKRPTLADGERCASPDECSSGVCKNVRNGIGVCCGAMIDCCKTADDCPESYASAPQCDDASSCKGSKTVAVCMSGLCASSKIDDFEACAGMKGPDCGAYKDIMCLAARSTTCPTSCTSDADCDANGTCVDRKCQLKHADGAACASDFECISNNCMNGTCCVTGQECCKTATDCKLGLDPKCDLDPATCQGSVRTPSCIGSLCRYSATRTPDDRECTSFGSGCGNFKSIECDGTSVQMRQCKTQCTSAGDCDEGNECRFDSGAMRCLPPLN